MTRTSFPVEDDGDTEAAHPMAGRPMFGISSINWSPIETDKTIQDDNATQMSVTEHIETTLINIVEDVAAATDMNGNVRLVDVEVSNEELANVTLHIQEANQ